MRGGGKVLPSHSFTYFTSPFFLSLLTPPSLIQHLRDSRVRRGRDLEPPRGRDTQQVTHTERTQHTARSARCDRPEKTQHKTDSAHALADNHLRYQPLTSNISRFLTLSYTNPTRRLHYWLSNVTSTSLSVNGLRYLGSRTGLCGGSRCADLVTLSTTFARVPVSSFCSLGELDF